jgi:signal transduction histidine kinase
MREKPLAVVVAFAVVASAATTAAALLPYVSFAYRNPSLHDSLEAASAVVATLAAYLVYGRFRASRRLSDLILVCALAVFAIANLLLSALPGALGYEGFGTWSPLVARLLGAALFAAAALAPRRVLEHPQRALVAALLACVAALAGVAIAVAGLSGLLPVGVDPALHPEEALLGGHPTIHAVQLVGALLFGAAAAGFLRRARLTGDELMLWLAAGSVLAAASRVNYFLFPSVYTEWVYTGDVLRLAFYVTLLVGAAREIEGYWRRLAGTAVLEERRRMARELHDGLAQELSYIVMLAKYLRGKEGGDGQQLGQIAGAAQRALDESRRAIAALTRPLDDPLSAAVAAVADEVAGRTGLDVQLEVDEHVDVGPAARDALLRIVGEAITNAARHGNARQVRVELGNGECVRLRIVDDGSGFDPDAVAARRPGSFGLTSMRERADALGGSLRIASRPGGGTEVEVRLP